MSQELKKVIFNAIDDFACKKLNIPWENILQDEDLMNMVDEAKNRIMHNFSLLPADSITTANKEALLGRLAFSHARLANLFEAGNKQEFLKEASTFENIIRDIMKASDWLTHAQKRYEDYAKIEQKTIEEPELPEITHEKLDYLRPVFLALDIFALLTADAHLEEEAEEADDDYEHEECDFEDED